MTIKGIDNFLKEEDCKGKSRTIHSNVIDTIRPSKKDESTAGII